ncbi:MAG: hypothetical protein P1U36_06385 [Legionellaceae bacterium]|nr:hypothetical protein [Legionellaceae bacterium]
MNNHDKKRSILLKQALYKAIMNHPEAKQAGSEALARCRPLPPKSSEHYKSAQDVRVMAFINAGKIPLIGAVQQDVDAAKQSAREFKACKKAGVSVKETTDRVLLAGVASLFPTHDREAHALFQPVVKDDQPSEQAQDISNEVDGHKPS